MNKTEIIESLYKSGKITFEEAMTLASKPEKEPELSLYDGAVADQAAIKKLNIGNLVKGLVEPLYEEDPDTHEKELVSLDLDKILDIMHHVGHQWYNSVTNRMEDVTLDRLKDYLNKTVRNCIDEFIEQNAEGKVDDYWMIDGAGFLVVCKWDDKEMTKVEVSIRYVPVEVTDFIDYDKIA